MELKKGMYIRIKDKNNNQFIRKIIELPEDIRYGSIVVDKDIHYARWVSKKKVIKASDNIIDLIEENDLLEIRYLIKSNEYQKELLQVIKNYAGKLYVNAFPKKIFIEDFDRYCVEILSILTKEQFESQKYIVESE